MKFLYFLIAFLFLFVNCTNSQKNRKIQSLGNFDIASDDSQIIFSYIKDNLSYVYKIDADGKNLVKVLSPEGDKLYISPKFSNDRLKILYIQRDRVTKKGAIFMCDISGKNKQQLSAGMNIITEAVFSRDGNSIFFCMANEYAAYSPIGVKAPHGTDIYNLRLIDNEISKISNLNAYDINSISELNDKSIMMRFEASKNAGIVLLSKDSGNIVNRIVPVNNPRKLPDIYYMPTFSEKFQTLVFTAPYEIFIMDINDKIAKTVFFNKGGHDINNLGIFKYERKILYTSNDDLNLHVVNYDGTGRRAIPINL